LMDYNCEARHCEEQRDEAIQKAVKRPDCFASLAMTLRVGSIA
jgi:hypothetical protein